MTRLRETAQLATSRRRVPRRCWWCARDGRRRLAVIALAHSRTHYCREHWRAYSLLAVADLLIGKGAS